MGSSPLMSKTYLKSDHFVGGGSCSSAILEYWSFEHSGLVRVGRLGLKIEDAADRVDEIIFGAERKEDHLFHQRAREIVDVAILVDLLDRRGDAIALASLLGGELVLTRPFIRAVDDLPFAMRFVGGVSDRPISKTADTAGHVRIPNHCREIEPPFPEIRLEATDALWLGVQAFTREVQLLDREVILVALHPFLEHFKVELHPVFFIADRDRAYADGVGPFLVKFLQVSVSLGERHPVAHAVEQVVIAGGVETDDCDCGAVA